jgi:5-aminolevulinate synthase
MYGPTGAGVAEHLDFDAYMLAGKTRERIPRSVMDRVDIITGESDQTSLNALNA